MKYQIMIGIIATGLITGYAQDEDRDNLSVKNESAGAERATLGTTFNELPAAVKATVKKHAPNVKIDDIDKETRTGRVVYEVQFADPGKNPKIHVAEDGTLLKSEDGKLGPAKASVDAKAGSVDASVEADVNSTDLSVNTETAINEAAGAPTGPKLGTKLEDLPDAVRKAIMSRAPNAKIDDIDKETRTGRVVYEVQFADPGKNPKIHVAEDGTLVKLEDGKLGPAEASVDAKAGSVDASVEADVTSTESSVTTGPAINEAAGAQTSPRFGTKLEDLPDAVRNAIMSRAPNAKIDDIDKETRTGRVVYEIQFEEPGANPKLHIAEDGTFVDGK